MRVAKEAVQIAYIGGGSRGWAWDLIGDLALDEQLSGVVRLYDIDFDSADANAIIGNQLRNRPDVKGKWSYEAVPTLKEALTGADFIIISILPGTFEEMASDVHLPERYGIYQSVGDTVGPGGMIRALRSIPMFVEIAESIRQFAPKAWVINYTNPMSLCTRTLYEIFPQIQAIGCCHEVLGAKKFLAHLVETELGVSGVHYNEIWTNTIGINHLTWFDQATYKGEDLFPLYERYALQYAESGYLIPGVEQGGPDDYFTSARRVQFDLFRNYGIIPVAGDRHLAEFFPGNWYLGSPEQIQQWKFALTPVSWRQQNLERLRRKSALLVSGSEQLQLQPSGEEGVRIIKGLLGFETFVTNVNLPNKGQIENLAPNAVVETNALVSGNCVRPLLAGSLPTAVEAVTCRHILNQETILQASLTGNRNLAYMAFINDPLVSGLHAQDAEQLFSQMLQSSSRYLPERFFEGGERKTTTKDSL